MRLQSIKDKEKPLMDTRKVGRSGHVCNLSSEDHLQLRSDPAPEAKQKITHKGTRQTGAFVGHNRESRNKIQLRVQREEILYPAKAVAVMRCLLGSSGAHL